MTYTKFSSNFFFASTSLSQQEYCKRVSEIVSQAVQEIKKNTSDLCMLFHGLVDTFGKERYKISRSRWESKTFGLRRENPFEEGGKEWWTPYMMTIIKNSGKYGVYNPRLISRIRPHFEKMIDEKLESLIVPEGDDASLNIQIVDAEKLREIDEIYQTKEGLWGFEKPEHDFIEHDILKVVCNKEHMEAIRKQSLDMYEKIKFVGISNLQLGVGSLYVKATLQHTIKDEPCNHTQYIISIFDDAVKDDSLEFAVNTFLVHQDVFLISNMLDDIASLFSEAIQWSGEDPQELIHMVAIITYKFAHATPFHRGSAAIGEWLETVIYAYHGYDMLYDNHFNINVEALILPFNDFVQQYPKMFKLESTSLISKNEPEQTTLSKNPGY